MFRLSASNSNSVTLTTWHCGQTQCRPQPLKAVPVYLYATSQPQAGRVSCQTEIPLMISCDSCKSRDGHLRREDPVGPGQIRCRAATMHPSYTCLTRTNRGTIYSFFFFCSSFSSASTSPKASKRAPTGMEYRPIPTTTRRQQRTLPGREKST